MKSTSQNTETKSAQMLTYDSRHEVQTLLSVESGSKGQSLGVDGTISISSEGLHSALPLTWEEQINIPMEVSHQVNKTKQSYPSLRGGVL